ncbi:MAG: hypothetical protein HGB10_08355 [Coriobacteriia bacterium]|nr:hypothetical protein [Coriobacteriia bacterium]
MRGHRWTRLLGLGGAVLVALTVLATVPVGAFAVSEGVAVYGQIRDANSANGLEGAVVTVLASPSGDYYTDTQTDADGYYELWLPNGDYSLEVDPGALKYAKGTAGPFTIDNVAPWQCDVDLDPLGRIYGTVQNESGDPVQDAAVWITRGSDTTELWCYADENGEFSIDCDWPAGDYTIHVSHSEYKRIDEDFYYDGPGSTASFGFVLPPPPIAFTGALTNAVTGQSVEGRVHAYMESDPSTQGWAYSSDGIYELTVPAGEYTIEVEKWGYPTKVVESNSFDGTNTVTLDIAVDPHPIAVVGSVTASETGLPAEGGTVHWAYVFDENTYNGWQYTEEDGTYAARGPAASFDVTANANHLMDKGASVSFDGTSTATLDLALERPPVAVRGKLLDSVTAEPLIGYVSISGYDADNRSWYEDAHTTADGAYEFRLPAGEYVLMGRSIDLHSETQKDVTYDGGATLEIDLESDPFPIAVEGYVRAAGSGAAVSGATVHLHHDMGGYWDNVSEVKTDAEGHYSLRAPVGGLEIETSARGFADRADTFAFDGTKQTLDIDLLPIGEAFVGTVTNAETELPVRGAEIHLTFEDGSSSFETWTYCDDADGSYSLDGPAGLSTLGCSADLHESAEASATFDGATPTTRDFALRKYSRALYGVVTDGSGAPVSDIGVRGSVDYQGETYRDTAYALPNGMYELFGPPGEWTIVVDDSKYERLELEREVTDMDLRLDLTLAEQPIAIRGVITDSVSHAPLSNADLHVEWDNGYNGQWIHSNDDGEYVFYGGANEYDILVEADGYESQGTTVQFDGTNTVDRDFDMVEFPTAYVGSVIDSDTGDPLKGVSVDASCDRDGDRYSDFTSTDENGEYEIHLPENDGTSFYVVAEGFDDHQFDAAGFDGTTPVDVGVTRLQRYERAVYGTVTDASTHAPIADLEIELWGDEDTFLYETWTRTAADGTYSLGAPGAGHYRLSPYIEYTSYEDVTFDLEYTGTPILQDIAMSPESYLPETTIYGVPSGWASDSVEFWLDAWDDGAGVAQSYYRFGADTPQTYDCTVTVSAEGTTNVTYWSVDSLGNTETAQLARVRIDRTDPVTTASVNATYYAGSAEITFTASDTMSGVRSTHYKLDDSEWTTGTIASIDTTGSHTIRFLSIDRAGNAETEHLASFWVAGGSSTKSAFTTIHASTLIPSYGKSVTLTGALKADSLAGSGIAGVPVALQKYSAGSWTTVKSITSGAGGTLSTSLVPGVTTTYRFHLAGDSTYNASTDGTVKVAPKAYTSAISTSRTGTRTYKISGSVKAGSARSMTVRIYRWKRVGSSWKTYSSFTTRTSYSSGALRYSVKHKFPSKGTWKLQVAAPETAWSAKTYSATKSFTVK